MNKLQTAKQHMYFFVNNQRQSISNDESNFFDDGKLLSMSDLIEELDIYVEQKATEMKENLQIKKTKSMFSY